MSPEASPSDGRRTESGLVGRSTVMVGTPDVSRVASEVVVVGIELAARVFTSRIATGVADCPSLSLIT